MNRFSLALTLIIAGTAPAAALDCIIGDAGDAFAQAASHANGSPYRAVLGQVAMTPIVMQREGQTERAPADFAGEVIEPDGTRTAIYEEITVSAFCLNGDCGYVFPAVEMLSFIHDEQGGPVMYSMPCQAYPIAANAQTIAEFASCATGGPCGSFNEED